MTSAISSNVPVPPGKAIKASPSSIILFLRSDISLVTISLVKSFCLHSHRCFQRNRSNPVLVFHAGMVGKAPGIPLFRIQIVGSVEKLQEFLPRKSQTAALAEHSISTQIQPAAFPALYLLRRFPVKRIRRPGFSDSILYMQFIQKFCKHLRCSFGLLRSHRMEAHNDNLFFRI